MAFLSVDCFLMLFRVLAAVHFIYQMWRHFYLSSQKRQSEGNGESDKFTFYTFTLLGVSVLSFIAYHTAEIVEDFYTTLYRDDPTRIAEIYAFLSTNEIGIRFGMGLFRIGFGYIL